MLLSPSLESNTSLIVLQVGGYYLSAKVLADGMQALRDNHTLEDLVLDVLEENSADVLVACICSLEGNRGLKTLHVTCGESNAGPYLSVEQGRSIIPSLRANFTLCTCPLVIVSPPAEDVAEVDSPSSSSSSSSSSESVDNKNTEDQNSDPNLVRREIGAFLRLNSVGREYMLEENPKKEEGVALLGNVSDNLDCIYFHLRENPGLCSGVRKISPQSSPPDHQTGGGGGGAGKPNKASVIA